MLRLATPADAEALLAIYAQYIDTPITFECRLPTLEEFRARIEDIRADYPYLVYEASGKIAGYAYAHRHMAREAYQWNAELSVYLDKSYQTLGLGKRLYTALIELLKLQGVRNVFGCITLPNDKSVGLHESLGFQRVGTYFMAGYKSSAWRDVCWYQKQIGAYDAPPAPLRSLGEVDPAAVDRILA